MNSRITNYSFSVLLFSACCFITSCSSDSKNAPEEQLPETREFIPAHDPPSLSGEISVKTFEVKDTLSGKSLGWGYDICIDGETRIHQPILPGVSGNQSFSSEEKAKITGEYAAKKMKNSGGLPTLTINELDSLGITK